MANVQDMLAKMKNDTKPIVPSPANNAQNTQNIHDKIKATPAPTVTPPSTPKVEEGGNLFERLTGNLFGKSAQLQAANAMQSVAALTRNEAAKSAMTPVAQKQQEEARERLEGPSFGNYLLRKAVGGAADTVEGVLNTGGYWAQGLAKGYEMQAANAMKSAAATAKNEYAKNVLTQQADKQQAEALKNLKTSTKTVFNFADNYAAKTEEMHADNDYGFVGNLAGDVAQGVGGMIPRLVAKGVPGLGDAITLLSSFGNAMQSAKNEGKSDAEALPYAFATAVVEVAIEKVSGLGDFGGKGFSGNIIDGIVKGITKNAAAQKGLRVFASGIAEGLEETVTEYANRLINAITIKTDERSFGETTADAFYNGLVGTVVGTLSSTANPDAYKPAEGKAPTESAENNTPTEGENLRSNGTLGNVANVTSETESAVPDYQGGEISQDGTQNANAIGVGGARIDSVATEIPYKMAPSRDKSTQNNAALTEEQKTLFAPQPHRVISEKESLAEWEQAYERDKDGNITNHKEAAKNLLEVPNWTARETDAAMTLEMEAAKNGDIETAIELDAARKSTNSEAARILQATQKWISEDGTHIVANATGTLTEAVNAGDVSKDDAGAVLKQVAELASEFDAISNDDAATSNIASSAINEAATSLGNAVGKGMRSSRGRKNHNNAEADREGNAQRGEPFVFEYADKVGEAVARGLNRAPAPQKTFLKQMASILRRFANEKVQKPAAEKPLTPTELLRDYIQNQEFYSQAWEAAQQALRDGEQLNPELEAFMNSGINFDANLPQANTIFMRALIAAATESGETAARINTQAALGMTNMDAAIANNLIAATGAEGEMANTIRAAASDYVQNVLNESETDIDKARDNKIKEAMRDIGRTITEVASFDANAKETIKRNVVGVLTAKYGFAEMDASYVADTVGSAFDALVQQSANKQIEQMLRVRPKPEAKSFLEKLQKLTNLGAFDSDQFALEVSQKLLGEGASAIDSELATQFVNAKTTKKYVDLIRKTAEMRNVIRLFKNDRKAYGEFSKMQEWALRKIVANGDVQFLKEFAASGIASLATDAKKATAGEMITTYRRLAMLSKISTVMRNLLGNAAIDGIDTLAGDISTVLDMAVSKRTGTRSVAVDKGVFSEAKRKGTINALAKSLLEVGLDVDTSGQQGRYESTSGRTFKMSGGAIERFFSTMEKMEGYTLVSTDAASRGGNIAETSRGLQRLAKKGKLAPTDGDVDSLISDMASDVAAYRVFQGDRGLTNFVLDARRAADTRIKKIGGEKGVGVGTFALPFAKTPINVGLTAADYSPVGLVQSSAELIKLLIRAKTQQVDPRQQAQLVRGVSRGVTGTTLIGLAAACAASGFIRTIGNGSDEDDKDKTAFGKMQGENGTQMNLSAILRWLSGEGVTDWQDGDTLMSISFLEPFNAHLATGALIAEEWQNEDATFWEKLWESIKLSPEGAFKAIMELPVLTTIQDAVNAYKYSDAENEWGKAADAAAQYAAGQVSSFIPNIVKGAAQGTDRYQRDTYAGDNLWEKTWSNIKASIPGARQTVDEKINSFGQPVENEGGFLNFLNSNILPGQITHYKEQTGGDILERIYEATGDAKIYPERKAPNTVEGFSLDADAKRQYMQTAGQAHEDMLAALEVNRSANKLTTRQMAELLNDIRLRAQESAKNEVIIANGGTVKQSDKDELVADMTPSEFINWSISNVRATTPAGYKTEPDWQTFERAADVLPQNVAISMMVAENESMGKKINAAVKANIPLDTAVAYYRAITERNVLGKSPTAEQKAFRISMLGLTQAQEELLSEIFK